MGGDAWSQCSGGKWPLVTGWSQSFLLRSLHLWPLVLRGEGAEGPEVSGWPVVSIASSGDPGPVPRGWPYQGEPWRVAGSRKPLMPEHI